MSVRRFQGSDSIASTKAWPHERVLLELPPQLAGPALKTAERWAARVLSELQAESRRIRGGWPGTLSEARALLAGDLLPQLAGESLVELKRVGQDEVARFLYQGAREYWIRHEHGRGARSPGRPV